MTIVVQKGGEGRKLGAIASWLLVLSCVVALTITLLAVVEMRRASNERVEILSQEISILKADAEMKKKAVDELLEKMTPILEQIKEHYDGDVLFGIASWYGPGFDGKLAADGKVFDMFAMTAAHRELPLGTKVRIENQVNKKSVVVTITDRGPYILGRLIDVSYGVAQDLGMVEMGLCPVKVSILKEE